MAFGDPLCPSTQRVASNAVVRVSVAHHTGPLVTGDVTDLCVPSMVFPIEAARIKSDFPRPRRVSSWSVFTTAFILRCVTLGSHSEGTGAFRFWDPIENLLVLVRDPCLLTNVCSVRLNHKTTNIRDHTGGSVSMICRRDCEVEVVSAGGFDIAIWCCRGFREQGRSGPIHEKQGCDVLRHYQPIRALHLEKAHDVQSAGG